MGEFSIGREEKREINELLTKIVSDLSAGRQKMKRREKKAAERKFITIKYLIACWNATNGEE